MLSPVVFGIITTSDRASRGEYEDLGTPEVAAVLQSVFATPFELKTRLVPDDKVAIQEALTQMGDAGCWLIVTTGGTGPARRDVTVEACREACDKPMPGFGELMRQKSLEKVPTAILSCQEAFVRYRDDGGTLVINLPGSIKAIRECLLAVMPAVPYCIELLGGPRLECNEAVVQAFRPKSAG